MKSFMGKGFPGIVFIQEPIPTFFQVGPYIFHMLTGNRYIALFMAFSLPDKEHPFDQVDICAVQVNAFHTPQSTTIKDGYHSPVPLPYGRSSFPVRLECGFIKLFDLRDG